MGKTPPATGASRMNAVDRMVSWNRWYDRLPPEWRFHLVLWPFIILGAINLMLTVSIRLPFGLLLILGFFAVGVVRAAYLQGRYRPSPALATASEGGASYRLPSWVIAANRRYDALAETQRI